MKKVIVIILSLLVIAFIGFNGKKLMEKRKEEIVNEPLPQKEKLSVNLTKATEGSLEQREKFLATIESQKSIKVSTKMAGYIKKVYVSEGQMVEKGTLLATIDDSDINSNIEILKTNLAQQQNDLALAKQIYIRNQKLYNIGGLAKEQLDTSHVVLQGKKSIIQSTRQKIDQLQEQKRYLNIKAPFGGEVENIIMYEGDLASVGRPILTMNNGVKKLVFSYVLGKNSIEVGQEVYIDQQSIGKIKRVKSIAKKALAQAEVAVDKPLNMPIGTQLNIAIITQKESGCIVPMGTILHKNSGTYLMVYRDKKFQPLKVNVLMSEGNSVLIDNCPSEPIALESEVKLAQLPVYGEIEVQ